ncbi:MAG: 1-acyl-sn-glycerol-3-phosphate acyltransferase [Bacteroidetes bacterium]|nr:1-acyl-sn-glycerol-3-phosphate acyltransferase [Bacteroidota bacterium]
MVENETVSVPERLIDIEAVFASKNPHALRFIPRFIISYLKRITHQDAINGYIYRNRDKVGLPFVEAILKEFGVNVTIVGNNKNQEIPANGRFIVAANHPLGGIDGMALMHALGRIRPDIVFPVNDLLMNVPGLRPLFIPINKHGRNKENAKLIDETFASDKLILYFPAGLVSRKQRINGKNDIIDLEWKNTFIKKAKKYQRDIIPVFVDGRNSEWFYNLSVWRKRLGITANIEMLYLVDEMIKQLNKTITIVVGEPIPFSQFDSSKTEKQWAEWVKQIVYRLGTDYKSTNLTIENR